VPRSREQPRQKCSSFGRRGGGNGLENDHWCTWDAYKCDFVPVWCLGLCVIVGVEWERRTVTFVAQEGASSHEISSFAGSLLLHHMHPNPAPLANKYHSQNMRKFSLCPSKSCVGCHHFAAVLMESFTLTILWLVKHEVNTLRISLSLPRFIV